MNKESINQLRYDQAVEFILRRGVNFKPGTKPAKLTFGDIGSCYDTCILAVLKNPELYYVEGVAKPPGYTKWVPHAWVSDGKLAFDLTWKAFQGDTPVPVPAEYVGIIIPTTKAAMFYSETRYKAIIMNAWRDPFLAKEALGAYPYDQVA